MEKEITLQAIERRLATLEKAVASLTAERITAKHSDEPRGMFAHLGGIERLPARSFETPEKEISFEHLGGRKVGHFRVDTPQEMDGDGAKTN